ncbi:MAG: hypothetical protein JNL66_11300, partial [Alphaproteobacteria bacterium]|nr:hypothetical protein [Alphaproteobacteria bacterium]
ARLARRRNHFMPPSLLKSQFATLEEPRDAIVADVTNDPPSIVAAAVAALRASPVLPGQ